MTTHSTASDLIERAHRFVPSVGVLITNLGTPSAPTPQALREYLGEFLWDPRVVRIPRLPWWLILHGIILRTRPAKSAHAYQAVWTEDGSPLLVISKRQRDAVQRELSRRFQAPVKVALAMRYGTPSIAEGLAELRAAHCDRIVVMPLYPQYSSATTASTFDAVAAVMEKQMWVPHLRFIGDYSDEAGYIAALSTSIGTYWQEHGKPQRLVFSFHGMPKATLLDGDPYHCQCQKTARLVAHRLGLEQDQWQVVFQSRFGKAEWLKPYADATLKALPGHGVKRVHVVCPGFAADCLETLEEMAMQNKQLFLDNGGESYDYIPALNDSRDHIAFLADRIEREVQGWLDRGTEWVRSQAESEANGRVERARAVEARLNRG